MKKQKAIQEKLRNISQPGTLPNGILNEAQDFLGIQLPGHIQEGLKDRSILKKADQNTIMNAIDFTPPFLRIEKILVFGDKNNFINSRSIGIGTITILRLLIKLFYQ